MHHTSYRAELRGVVAAAERHAGAGTPLDLTLDNLDVVNAASKAIRTGRIPRATNGSLWTRFLAAVNILEGNIVVCWCKGHATQEHEDAGVITAKDRYCNAQADAIATEAADSIGESEERSRRLHERRNEVMMLQRMYVAVVEARRIYDKDWAAQAEREEEDEVDGQPGRDMVPGHVRIDCLSTCGLGLPEHKRECQTVDATAKRQG